MGDHTMANSKKQSKPVSAIERAKQAALAAKTEKQDKSIDVNDINVPEVIASGAFDENFILQINVDALSRFGTVYLQVQRNTFTGKRGKNPYTCSSGWTPETVKNLIAFLDNPETQKVIAASAKFQKELDQ